MKKCREIYEEVKVHWVLSLQKQENVMKQSKTLGIL